MSAPPSPAPRQITGSSPALPTFVNAVAAVPITIGTPGLSLQPIQIVGLIPVYPCDSEDCRENCDTVCAPYRNPVFGELTATGHTMKSTYENDFNSFFFDFPLIKKNVTGFTVVFTIEKLVNGVWTTAITITNNSYGVYYPFGGIAFKPTYTGVSINWGAVLDAEGEGCYRLKLNMSYTTLVYNNNYTGTSEPVLTTYTDCAASPIFDLKEFDCVKAHGTAKFEVWSTGVIGDPYADFLKHNLCGRTLFDSIRVWGMIGFQTTPTYKMDNNKWGSPKQGLIERVRDEQIQQWVYESGLLPEYIHTRFSTFAMMSEMMFASDYNINNSDWTIKRKNIIKSPNTGYEPEWLDRTADWQKRNKGHVKVTFNRGIQSVEKYNCCTTLQINIGGTATRP